MTNTINDNWYVDFFKGINCELWEKAVSPELTKQETDFIREQLQISAGAKVLDAPCGFGRHSLELARHGFRVTGVDISATFLEKLEASIKEEKLGIKVVLADLLTVKLEEYFDGAICMGNSFGYFKPEKMELFVSSISSCLKPGARWIIHSGMLAECILPNLEEQSCFEAGGIRMEINNTYDLSEGCLLSHILYTKAGQQERAAFKHYVYTFAEVKRLLQRHELEVTGAHASLSGAPFRLGDQQVYLVVQKR